MLTLAKTLSWAVVSAIIIGTTTYVETTNVQAALVTALVASMLKTPVYHVHEMAWNRIKKQKKERNTIKLYAPQEGRKAA